MNIATGWTLSPFHEFLMEESVIGWKEYELEVVRDRARQRRHCLLNREFRSDGSPHGRLNFTVAPAQTLTDKEYQRCGTPPAIIREVGVERRQQYSVCRQPSGRADDCY